MDILWMIPIQIWIDEVQYLIPWLLTFRQLWPMVMRCVATERKNQQLLEKIACHRLKCKISMDCPKCGDFKKKKNEEKFTIFLLLMQMKKKKWRTTHPPHNPSFTFSNILFIYTIILSQDKKYQRYTKIMKRKKYFLSEDHVKSSELKKATVSLKKWT